jgi:hypothetical protein
MLCICFPFAPVSLFFFLFVFFLTFVFSYIPSSKAVLWDIATEIPPGIYPYTGDRRLTAVKVQPCRAEYLGLVGWYHS